MLSLESLLSLVDLTAAPLEPTKKRRWNHALKSTEWEKEKRAVIRWRKRRSDWRQEKQCSQAVE